ncbi:hypothetical protein [Bradyrhizobium manausense]|uniref:hypothetical protein n=1 Tax=Bradyrhizobium manausense TaxID=989370 RepID=UPI003D9B11C8
MRVGGSFFEIVPMPRKIAAVFPDDFDTRVVHPAMIKTEVAIDIDCSKRQHLTEPRNEAGVTDADGLRRPARMALATGQHVQLRMATVRRRPRQPEPRLLPEQSRFGNQHLAFADRDPFPDQDRGEIAIITTKPNPDRPLAGGQRLDRGAERGQQPLYRTSRHVETQTLALRRQPKDASDTVGIANVDDVVIQRDRHPAAETGLKTGLESRAIAQGGNLGQGIHLEATALLSLRLGKADNYH